VGVEIERKFLLNRLPAEVEQVPGSELRQGYVALDGDTEVRVRLERERAVLTFKRGGGRTRMEEEIELTAAQAEALWELTGGRRIEKLRRRVDLGGSCVEVDEYHGDLAGLLVAEVEFYDESAAERFSPPEWMGREVTDDSAYKNRSLACDGVPGAAR